MKLPRRVRQYKVYFGVVADTHPFEMFLALFVGLVAVPLVVMGHAPDSLQTLAPVWAVRVWGIELVLGSVATLWGLFSTQRPYLEEFGLLLISVAAAVYAIALVVIAQTTGLTAASFMIAISFACWRRRRNVRRTIIEIDDSEVWRDDSSNQEAR